MINEGIPPDFGEKRKQINTLKVFNDNVSEIVENQEYSVEFVSNGKAIVLKVLLSPNFPNEKPGLFVKPIWPHPWIEPQSGQITDAPGLLNFTIHSDLGRVVQAVIRELERNGPKDSQETSPTQKTNYIEPQKQICLNFPQLTNLSLDALKELNSNPEALKDFVDEMEPVKNLTSDLDKLMAEVEELAKTNLSRNGELSQKREVVLDLLKQFKDVGDVYNQENYEYTKKKEEFEPEHIKELLQIAASVADSECEQVVDKFLQGDIDVHVFLNSYLQTKKLSAERKTKEERLSQQLKELEKANFS